VRRSAAAGELIDGPAACDLLGCSPSTLRRRLAAGELSGAVVGPRNRRYYPRAVIENYLAAHRRPSRHEGPAPGGQAGRIDRRLDAAAVRRLVAAGLLFDSLGACELLGCAPSTLRKRVAAGEVTGQVVGPRTRRYWTRAGLEEYLASR
jgi:hypothetical protein